VNNSFLLSSPRLPAMGVKGRSDYMFVIPAPARRGGKAGILFIQIETKIIKGNQ